MKDDKALDATIHAKHPIERLFGLCKGSGGKPYVPKDDIDRAIMQAVREDDERIKRYDNKFLKNPKSLIDILEIANYILLLFQFAIFLHRLFGLKDLSFILKNTCINSSKLK